MIVFQCLSGSALTLVGWMLVRRVAGVTTTSLGLRLLDALGPVLWFAVLLAASARPVFAGLVSFATFGGLAFADYFKRETLREPVVFTDSVELIEVVRHPELYLPFVGPKRVIAGAVLAAAAFCALAFFEPAIWRWSVMQTLGAGAAFVLLVGSTMGPLQSAVTRLLTPVMVTGDPAADGARLGPLVVLLVYGVRARAERAGRALAAKAASSLPNGLGPAPGHVVLIQAESFVDPRRLSPDVPHDLLPNFDRAKAAGPQHGRMLTPTWGANTVRTEFEALTGVPDEALGFDRFNPYYAFVRDRSPSLATSLKARGYRTVCLHPYSRSFYGRNRVLPKLGFDAFFGIEAFREAPTRRGFVLDAAIAALAEDILAKATQPTFIFVITMENHGPWAASPGRDAGPHESELETYVRGAISGDDLLGRLGKAVGADRGEGLLAFYGDHCPMLTTVEDDGKTDYVIWRKGEIVREADIMASSLAVACLAALDR